MIKIILLSLIIFTIYFLIYKFNNKNLELLDKYFYNVNDMINVDLNSIDKYKYSIYQETVNVYYDLSNWTEWPEKNLYPDVGEWKIFPFFVFGNWILSNCKKCPIITKFLKNIQGLKVAALSKLSSNMKLYPHTGWASHSNNVIRCHYGLIVPEGCYVSVSNGDVPLYNMPDEYKLKQYPNKIVEISNNEIIEEIRFIKQFEWTIFDDSKNHYAHNMSKNDRIVLIIDIERPKNIKTGVAVLGDTSELIELVNYYKSKNN